MTGHLFAEPLQDIRELLLARADNGGWAVYLRDTRYPGVDPKALGAFSNASDLLKALSVALIKAEPEQVPVTAEQWSEQELAQIEAQGFDPLQINRSPPSAKDMALRAHAAAILFRCPEQFEAMLEAFQDSWKGNFGIRLSEKPLRSALDGAFKVLAGRYAKEAGLRGSNG